MAWAARCPTASAVQADALCAHLSLCASFAVRSFMVAAILNLLVDLDRLMSRKAGAPPCPASLSLIWTPARAED